MSETLNESWASARRIEEWAGEIRVNRVRLAAIIVFYARHLVDVWVQHRQGIPAGNYHAQVTGVIVAWTAMVAVLHWLLSQRRVAPSMKYISTAWDLAMVTILCAMTRDGRTPLALLFFPVIATAPLRLSLKLVWVATLGAWAGYCLVLMHYAWVVIGWDKYYATPELRIPRSTEAIFILSLGATGLLAGQAVRQMRRLVEGYPVTVAPEEKGAADERR
jgi:hypothetical protein